MGVSAKVRLLLTVFLGYTLLHVLFFAPQMLRGRLPAFGDGQNIAMPFLLSERGLWSPHIFSGYPTYADPQSMLWYAPSWIVSSPTTFCVFILLAFILASSFMHGYVFCLTGSHAGAAVAGTCYALCAWMVVHQPHANMIHSAAWMPLFLWSLEELRKEIRPGWCAAAASAVGMALLAGHPQIVFYMLFLSAGYVLLLGWQAPAGRWRYYGASFAMVCLGFGLAAILILPMKELTGQSVRTRVPFLEFANFPLKVWHWWLFFYPCLFGGYLDPITDQPRRYFGPIGYPSEAVPYVGLLPLMFALIGLVATFRRGTTRYWAFAAVLCLVFAMGPESPTTSLLHKLPVFSMFRFNCRWILGVAFAVAVLAGVGVSSLEPFDLRGRVARLLSAWGVVAVVGIVLLVSWTWLRHRSPTFQYFPTELSKNWAMISANPLRNPAVALPWLVMAIGVVASLAWAFSRQRLAIGVLAAATALDLASYDWNCFSLRRAPDDSELREPAALAAIRDQLTRERQRLAIGYVSEFSNSSVSLGNRPLLWQLPVIGGDAPLAPKRYLDLAGLDTVGIRSVRPLEVNNTAYDLLGVRYLVLARESLLKIPVHHRLRLLEHRPEATDPSLIATSGKSLEQLTQELLSQALQLEEQEARWKEMRSPIPGTVCFENRRALPRAWLAAESVVCDGSEVLSTIQTGQVRGERKFDPARSALVEDAAALVGGGTTGRVEWIRDDRTQIELRTFAEGASFLVLADAFDNSWQATVDDVAVPVFRANYVQRGLVLPPGEHRVRFEFRPRSLYVGAAMSLGALAGVLALLALEIRRLARSAREDLSPVGREANQFPGVQHAA